MNRFISFILIVGFFSISQLVYPDSISDTYNTGDTLTATMLNNIKSAVNDNDSRIAALEAAPKANIAATPPTPFDDINAGFTEGSVWVDMTNKDAYILVDSAPGAAVWEPITNKTIIYSIGDTGPAGGIVFYVTDGGLHGLEAAPVNQGAAPWGCGGVNLAGADGTAVGTGAQNTADILAGCGEPNIAARLTDAYTLNGFDDWFLPSKDEQNELCLNRVVLGGFIYPAYWSSSEFNDGNAWLQDFGNCLQGSGDKNYVIFGVRAVRAF